MFKKINFFYFIFYINISLLLICGSANSKNCYKEDFVNFVSDPVGCIAINIHKEKNFNENLLNKNKLIIFIHGDQSDTKVTYFNEFASNFAIPDALVISITRPGWSNINNHSSDGKINISNGDNYIPKVDVDPIYRTINKLKKKYKLKDIIVVGHSGGAAITGILYGRFPKIIKEAILISCPCIVPPWRKNYYDQILIKKNEKFCIPKFKSHSPHEYVDKINPKLKINIFVAKQDRNTLPIYSIQYQDLLSKHSLQSEMFFFEGNHVNVLNNENLRETLKKIINL